MNTAPEQTHSPSILRRIADGEESAVNDCLNQYGNLVWSFARRMCPHDAEDATQEIFLEIWQTADRFDPQKSSESSFVAMIARRRLIDRIRKSGRNAATSLDDSSVEIETHQESDVVELADEAAKAADCLAKLTPRKQEVLELSIHHGVSHSGIANRLKMPLGSVKTVARRALIQLRDCMGRPSQVVDAPTMGSFDGGAS